MERGWLHQSVESTTSFLVWIIITGVITQIHIITSIVTSICTVLLYAATIVFTGLMIAVALFGAQCLMVQEILPYMNFRLVSKYH